MSKKKVLFICIHNSARSQMAEAFLDHLAGQSYQAESAGLEPGELNPLVVEVLKEDGIDISGKRTKSVHDIYRQGRSYDYVITVCSAQARQRCPVFPGRAEMMHWPFEDPSSFKGSRQEKLEKTRKIRDKIKKRIKEFIERPG
ncbi:MAG: arsenate reductase ArsC [Candidatus Omnitrophica bacterium]|nr:arsenate reductase ArsC [Candidatus Omnitrophota bacterium]